MYLKNVFLLPLNLYYYIMYTADVQCTCYNNRLNNENRWQCIMMIICRKMEPWSTTETCTIHSLLALAIISRSSQKNAESERLICRRYKNITLPATCSQFRTSKFTGYNTFSGTDKILSYCFNTNSTQSLCNKNYYHNTTYTQNTTAMIVIGSYDRKGI